MGVTGVSERGQGRDSSIKSNGANLLAARRLVVAARSCKAEVCSSRGYTPHANHDPLIPRQRVHRAQASHEWPEVFNWLA